ncbi:MAG TPA: cupin domain-containing protein [Methylomirabilota bacterium]|nr:cupin domain-containing protein [Methylomirabilota bacterium]
MAGGGEPAVRAAVAAAFPGCPPDVVDDFIAALGAPSERLVAGARITLAKPYGANHILAAGGPYGLSFARFEPGRSTSLHYHTVRRELFCVRRGVLTLTSGPTVRRLRPFEVGRSTPGEPHALANEGAELLEVLEIFSPALLDDKVRVRDRYNRALGAVGLHQ